MKTGLVTWLEYDKLKPSRKTLVKHVYLATELRLSEGADESDCFEVEALRSLFFNSESLGRPFLDAFVCSFSSVLGSMRWIENVWPSRIKLVVMNVF